MALAFLKGNRPFTTLPKLIALQNPKWCDRVCGMRSPQEKTNHVGWIGDRVIHRFQAQVILIKVHYAPLRYANAPYARAIALIEIEAPVFILVEAKKADLKAGLGQCAAEMIAAQRFNQVKGQDITTIYGCVSNGTQWRFMQLEEQQLTIDLFDYPLPPVGQILAFLAWMAEH
ncbi:MAG: hypothetical protein AAGD25_02925 [Cyanobacteria bacterium P01_F01_bin.150]